MTGSSPHAPMPAVQQAVARALADDLGPLGDLTSSLLAAGATGVAEFVPRADGILAGRLPANETFAQLDPEVELEWMADDGDRVVAGMAVARLRGPLASILTGERTALNFLCHLSGVATLTSRYVAAVAGRAAIRDTRKITPGLGALEKAAVRAGGGVNHRGSLSDGILVKDNHLAGLSIVEAVERAHRLWPGRLVQVECDRADQVKEAVAAGADAILLDNFGPAQVAATVAEVRASAPRCLIEVSGGVTLDTVGTLAEAGADLISVGALTHSAPALDIGLDVTDARG